ncbi:hypothetical protein [Nocardiopsis rhodophaea]|uniref:hypothetical protein n=1 Tax=Nocardiopsis rhodophaea TaxID=280238 RepID=UPI0031D5F73B
MPTLTLARREHVDPGVELLVVRNPGWWVEHTGGRYRAARVDALGQLVPPHLDASTPSELEAHMRRDVDELLDEELRAVVRAGIGFGSVPAAVLPVMDRSPDPDPPPGSGRLTARGNSLLAVAPHGVCGPAQHPG